MSPKRLAPDIDDQMIRATIELGAREGIGKITTLKVARACGVAEPTVYRHFESKMNLMYQAFLLLEREVLEVLKDKKFDFTNLKEGTRQFEDLILNCLISRPDETVYYNSYRHSAYYTEPHMAETRETQRVYETYIKNNKKLKKFADVGYPVMYTFIVENMMNFAEKIATGMLEDTEALRESIHMLVFGVILND